MLGMGLPVDRYNKRGQHSLCQYVIKDNKIYRRTYGEHVGFKMFMDAMLLSLTRKLRLPDLEFFVNLGDWPLERKGRAVPRCRCSRGVVQMTLMTS